MSAAPRSFTLNAASGACTKLAEQVASPDVVLASLLVAVAAPVGFVGALEPIRRGLAMAPQLVASGRMRRAPRRKVFWVAAGLTQAVALMVVAAAAAVLSGVAAGAVVLGALAVFSLASGVGSVAFSDVVGATVPPRRRGRLLGVRSAAGGGAAVAVGVALAVALSGGEGRGLYVGLALAAAALWALAAALFGAIPEPRHAQGPARSPLAEARAGLAALTGRRWFATFTAARALLLSAELAIPFYVLAGRRAGVSTVGLFIAAAGLAQLVGSPVWGRVVDRRSARLALVAGGVVGVAAAATALGLTEAGAGGRWFAVAVLLAGLARAGVRIARKTYVVNAAPPDERPLYTAASNTAAGALSLAFGLLGLLAQLAGVTVVIEVILALGAAGAVVAARVPEAEIARRA